MSKSGLRVSIIGGGSTYTPGLIEGLIRQRSIPLEELVLMDIDPDKLETVGSYVRRMLDVSMPGVKVVLTTQRSDAIRGMDFILCQIRVGGLKARHIDESIPLQHGVVGQETTGPGGFSMALRTIPVMVDIAREIELTNPGAWLINYTNPTGLVAEAIRRACQVKHISICDEPMVLQESLAAFLGVQPHELFLDYFGLNHLAWARRVLLRGRDVLPDLRQAVMNTPYERIEALFGPEATRDPKVRMELRNTLRILAETGMLPSPYLQYYFFTDEIIEYQKSSGKTRAQEVMELEAAILQSYRQATIRELPCEESRQATTGEPPRENSLEPAHQRSAAGGGESLSAEAAEREATQLSRGGKWHADMMIGLLAAIAGDRRELYIVNVPNNGSIPDLPWGKIVEVPALVDASGAHPLAMGHMPARVRGLIQAVAAYEELTVEAALEGSYDKALDALSCHPLVPSRTVARRILDAYLEAHKPMLPQFNRKNR